MSSDLFRTALQRVTTQCVCASLSPVSPSMVSGQSATAGRVTRSSTPTSGRDSTCTTLPFLTSGHVIRRCAAIWWRRLLGERADDNYIFIPVDQLIPVTDLKASLCLVSLMKEAEPMDDKRSVEMGEERWRAAQQQQWDDDSNDEGQ